MKRKLSLRTENEPPNYENEVRMKIWGKYLKQSWQRRSI